MPKVTIDGTEVDVEAGMTVIQACEQAGIEIPRFCYHDRLKIAGNCRMCLVEVKPGPPKPAASCALPVSDGMEVRTDTPMVKKAREGVMEFLLINHPLDCPICDQGGECDLQDQAREYGQGFSRYTEEKRAVEEKYMGPLIKTQMTRCIHCTRCVRFAEDVAGVPALGAIGRGEHMEITTDEKAFASELSGNVVDLCPVGALTSKPYAFVARPWELKKTETIDVHDAMGSNIRVDSRGNAVLRVLPRLHEEINEEWLGDKSRHACDGLRSQRLDKPYIRKNGKLQPASWDEALALVASKLKNTAPESIGAIAGDLVSVEAMLTLKDVMDGLGVTNLDCRQDGAALPSGERGDYLFNSTIAGIEDADCVVLIGANPRIEAPVLNARIRKSWLEFGTEIHAVGEREELAYPVEWHANNPHMLNEILAGAHPIAKALEKAEHPMIIVGMGALAREDGSEIHTALKAIAKQYGVVNGDWNGFNVLHTAAARVGGMDIGFLPQTDDALCAYRMVNATRSGEIELLYLMGADEVEMGQISADCFVIYQGHHGDNGAHRADVVLPAAAFTEQDGLYVNMEGRVQAAYQAVYAPGEAKEDWKILRGLSEALGAPLAYNTLEALRERLCKEFPHFAKRNMLQPAAWTYSVRKKKFAIDGEPFVYAIQNYYFTDAIARHSKTMAECSAVFQSGKQGAREAA